MKAYRALLSLLLCAALILSAGVLAAAAGPSPCQMSVTAGDKTTLVRYYCESYDGNLYLCLGDLSRALNGTAKQFRVEYQNSGTDGEYWKITRGSGAAAQTGTPQAPVSASAPVSLSLRRNRLFVDGSERRYYTYRADDKELYMGLTDVQLMLDLTAEPDGEGGLTLLLDQAFLPDPYELKEEDYFGAFNAVLVGDADTGEILFSVNRAWRYPIASVSKLMSYLLIAEDVEAGKLSWEDNVPISGRAAAISWSADGIINMATGSAYPVEELTQAMMLASSNESALALAEYDAGSEEAFVERMNRRAEELGLYSARFYTPHGLPSYSDSGVPGKRQNAMSASDLFTLSSLLLQKYPQLTEMTGMQFVRLEKMKFTTANSNPLVFNMPGVNGLKTGSTNRAGYCLVATLPVTAGTETHTLVLVVLGAESAELRGQGAEILLRWAQDYCQTRGFAGEAELSNED